MQLRFECALTCAQYVSQQRRHDAIRTRCPLHPDDDCQFARHGTYTRVARWCCPEGHCTFSQLPDCLAARFSGTLSEVEAVVRAAERAPSLDIELPGALRWVRRRVQEAHGIPNAIRVQLAEPFATVSARPQMRTQPSAMVALLR